MLDDETDALNLLEDLSNWELAPPRWEEVRKILDIALQAADDGDLPALERAMIDLESSGPVMITRIGTTPSVPPPSSVRERVNRLKHTLSRTTREAEGATGDGESTAAGGEGGR
jgi:hypothetical protein